MRGRKDYTLLREGQLDEFLLGGTPEDGEHQKERASVLRLLALAKEEACVRFPLYLPACRFEVPELQLSGSFGYGMTALYDLRLADPVAGNCCTAHIIAGNCGCAEAGRPAHRYLHQL